MHFSIIGNYLGYNWCKYCTVYAGMERGSDGFGSRTYAAIAYRYQICDNHYTLDPMFKKKILNKI